MNIYENIIILDASLSDEATSEALSKIKDLITSSNGEILKTDLWGKRKLAYEVNKHSKGFYVLLLFRSPAEVIKKLEDYYKVFDPVIKFMIIRLEKKQAMAALSGLVETTKKEKETPSAQEGQ